MKQPGKKKLIKNWGKLTLNGCVKEQEPIRVVRNIIQKGRKGVVLIETNQS